MGPWALGALSITTDDEAASNVPQTNFTVARLKRDVLSKSAVGGIIYRRSESTTAPGATALWGLDANFNFYQNVYVGGYASQSKTEGLNGNDLSYRGQFNYSSDRYGFVVDRVVVEPNFNPDIGFLRRRNYRTSYAQARFSPRTVSSRLIRRYTYQGNFEYTTDNNNHLESREALASYGIDFHNADGLNVQHAQLYEFLPAPFRIARGVTLPVGGYDFHNTRFSFTSGPNHRVTGTPAFEIGTFYGGDKTAVSYRGRIELTSQLGFEPNISLNWVDVPQGAFRDTVLGGRAFYTMSPRSFVAALIQYSSSNSSLSTNIRFRWEYQPGSEVFVVYSDGRSTLPAQGTELVNRGFVVKVNRLFRF